MVDNRLPAPGFINPPSTAFRGVTGYLSAVAPTALLKSLVLFNKNDITPVIKSDINFYNISKNLKNPENNWYLNQDVLPDLRIRTIMSFNPQETKILDFLCQRFNEYQASKMAFQGKENASILYEFLTRAVENSFVAGDDADEVFQLELFDEILSSDGPFDSIQLTRNIKNSSKPFLNYANVEASVIEGVIVHDVPLQNLLIRDKQGSIAKRRLQNLPWQIGTLTNSDDYKAEMVSSNGFQIDLSEFGIENVATQSLSVYCFCYYDYESFIERFDSGTRLSMPQDTSAIRNGIGFIDAKTFLGSKTVYVPQEGESVVGPTVDSILQNPDQNEFSDIRTEQNIAPDALRNKLQDTFYSTMVGAIGAEKTISQIIKNQNHFSNLWICKDQAENTRYSFAFDLASYLAEHSPFPFLYVSRGTSNELLNGGQFIDFPETSKVVSLKTKKRRVEKYSYVSTNDLSTETTKKYQDDRLGFEKYIGEATEIKNLFLAEGATNNIKVYEGVYFNGDEKRTQADIDCQYGVDVVIHDSSLLFLSRVQTALTVSEKLVRDIYELIITSPPNAGIYDQNSNVITTALSNIPIRESNAEQVITQSIQFYLGLLDNFGVIRSNVLDIFLTNITARISTGDPDAIKRVADLIEAFCKELNSLLRSYYPTNTKTNGSVESSKIQTSRTTKNLLIEKQHYFKTTSDYGMNYGSGYSYLTSQQPNTVDSVRGLSRISKQDHLSRASLEFSKYFNIQGSLNPDALSSGYANSSISYYSPLEINIFGKPSLNQTSLKIDNENSVDYDFNRYAELFLDILKLKKNKKPFQNLQYKQENETYETSLSKQTQDLFSLVSCDISKNEKAFFEELASKNIKDDALTVVGRQEGYKFNAGVGSTLLGGGEDVSKGPSASYSASPDEAVKDLEDALIDSDFKNLKNKDDKEDVTTQKKNMPTKIVFNILGELLINESMNDTQSLNYNTIDFNSLNNLSVTLGANTQNIQDLLSTSDVSSMPNQLKSMIVLATMNEGLSLGNGFDAVRPKLKDKVEIEGNNYISAVFNDSEYPPFERTGDPMKTYAKMLAFWMNYKQLVCVEYLAGFSSLKPSAVSRYYLQKQGDDEYYYKTKRPIWKKFTQTFYENNFDKKFLCRLRPISDLDFSFSQQFIEIFSSNSFLNKSEIFDLPIYNKYFLLNGNTGD